MRERNATDVGGFGGETHGGDDVGGVGSELWSGEDDAFGGAGGCGRELEVGAIRWRSTDGWKRLVCFEGAGNGVGTPGAKEIKNEGGCGSARKDDWFGRVGPLAFAEKIGKGPACAGRQIEESEFARMGARDREPLFVEELAGHDG